MKRKRLDPLTIFEIGNVAGPFSEFHATREPSSPLQPIPPYCHWRIRVIHDYWNLMRPDSVALPGYQHINLSEIPELAPYVWLIDVARNPMRFRFHTIGSAIVAWAAEDNTGRWLDDVWPAYDPAAFSEVVESRQPSWRYGPSTFRPERYDCNIERVRLPLARNGTDVDIILALSVFFDRQRREISP